MPAVDEIGMHTLAMCGPADPGCGTTRSRLPPMTRIAVIAAAETSTSGAAQQRMVDDGACVGAFQLGLHPGSLATVECLRWQGSEKNGPGYGGLLESVAPGSRRVNGRRQRWVREPPRWRPRKRAGCAAGLPMDRPCVHGLAASACTRCSRRDRASGSAAEPTACRACGDRDLRSDRR